ncbi:MAG: hypothetical protein H6722_00010 [Sandaracinus sp.]|nr:hypothetical protein [Sandaracinus sp.]
MSVRVPRHALTFMRTAAKLATKHGLKKGLAEAAAKANPALMVLEAAVSVADAVNSYLKLREAREHRDGLRRLLPHEADRLQLERDKLENELELAKAQIDQRARVQGRLGALVLACSSAYSAAWKELQAIRSSDLPDIEAFDRKLEGLDESWEQLRRALANYAESTD